MYASQPPLAETTGPAIPSHGHAVRKLEVQGVSVAYPKRHSKHSELAVDRVSFYIASHEFLCIVGPSGCGKSSILNAIAGLLRPAQGVILLDGNPIAGAGRNRSVVFQSPALLPWRTALQNVRYGLELWGTRRSECDERARDMLDLVGLGHRAGNYPHELSGGMQQRVNLARALAVDPEILLLDEPFAALDAQTRETMQIELLRIWAATRKASLFVTHQIDEAVLLADRVLVLSKGPGRILDDIRIDLPRPRDDNIRRDRAFFEYEDRIRGLIKLQEIQTD